MSWAMQVSLFDLMSAASEESTRFDAFIPQHQN